MRYENTYMTINTYLDYSIRRLFGRYCDSRRPRRHAHDVFMESRAFQVVDDDTQQDETQPRSPESVEMVDSPRSPSIGHATSDHKSIYLSGLQVGKLDAGPVGHRGPVTALRHAVDGGILGYPHSQPECQASRVLGRDLRANSATPAPSTVSESSSRNDVGLARPAKKMRLGGATSTCSSPAAESSENASKKVKGNPSSVTPPSGSRLKSTIKDTTALGKAMKQIHTPSTLTAPAHAYNTRRLTLERTSKTRPRTIGRTSRSRVASQPLPQTRPMPQQSSCASTGGSNGETVIVATDDAEVDVGPGGLSEDGNLGPGRRRASGLALHSEQMVILDLSSRPQQSQPQQQSHEELYSQSTVSTVPYGGRLRLEAFEMVLRGDDDSHHDGKTRTSASGYTGSLISTRLSFELGNDE